MKLRELRQIIREEISKARLSENVINNTYVIKDEELSNEFGEDYYVIDTKKALEYLSKFGGMKKAKQFINDDEGWGEFEQYLEDVEQMSNKELETAMKNEMAIYYGEN